MSEHRIIVELRQLHPQIWVSLTTEQKRIALTAANGQADKKTLEAAYRTAKRGN